MTPLLQIKNISKSFGIVKALRSVNLDINAGEVLALVGENGAGKSTLMRILEGEHQPDTGELLFSGQSIRITSASQAHRLGIYIIHQEPEIIPELSVAENIFLGEFDAKAGFFVDWASLQQRTKELFTLFGVEQELSPKQLCTALSPAQRQLIEILRALKSERKILAFDEPTSSLTEEEAQRLFVFIQRLREQGKAIIYISHRLHEVKHLADKIAVLRDGELIDVCDADNVTDQLLIKLMVGRDIEQLFHHKSHRQQQVILETKHLSTKYVHDICLSINAGEIVGLGGLIGAGRTELARAIFAADAIHSGNVLIKEKVIHLRSPADAINAGIGLAPEDRKSEALLLMRSISHNMSICVPDRISHFLGLASADKEQRLVERLISDLEIKTPSAKQEVGKLSGGNQQKVVLGRWLARKPVLLILDEPTRGIDVGAKAAIYQLIEELAAKGIAILLISSEMTELLGLTDRILVMKDGRIVGEQQTAQATEESILEMAITNNKVTEL